MRPGLVKIVAIQLGLALRASWWTTVAGSCLGASAALLLLHVAPQRYEAVATVRVHHVPGHRPDGPDAARLGGRMGIPADVVRILLGERAVRAAVERVFGPAPSEERLGEWAEDVRGRLLVERAGAGDGNAIPVEVRYRDEDADRAARVVNTLIEVCSEQGADDGPPAGSTHGAAPRSRGNVCETAAAADVPSAPVTPPRIPLIALGVLAGCLVCAGPVLTRRYLNPVISSATGLCSLSGVPLMARIPRINTSGTKRERARCWIKNIGLSLLSVAALVAALVTLL